MTLENASLEKPAVMGMTGFAKQEWFNGKYGHLSLVIEDDRFKIPKRELDCWRIMRIQ